MYLAHAEIAVEQKQTWQVLTGLRPTPRRAIPKAWWAVVAALLLSVLVLYVHTVVQEAHLLREQQTLKQIKNDLTTKRAQLASFENPRYIEAVATEKLAMQEPSEVVFLSQVQQPSAPKVNRIPLPQAVIHEGF